LYWYSNNNYLVPTTNWVVQAQQAFVLTRTTTSQTALNQSSFESDGNTTFTAY